MLGFSLPGSLEWSSTGAGVGIRVTGSRLMPHMVLLLPCDLVLRRLSSAAVNGESVKKGLLGRDLHLRRVSSAVVNGKSVKKKVQQGGTSKTSVKCSSIYL